MREAGGVANAATQDAFCAGTDCVVSEILDQSPNNNHLPRFNYSTPQRSRVNKGVNASADRHTLGGQPVYSAWFGEAPHAGPLYPPAVLGRIRAIPRPHS